MTLDRVSTKAAQVRKYERRAYGLTDARAELRDSMREAHNAGHSMRAIAQAAGISHQRVAQLLQKGETK